MEGLLQAGSSYFYYNGDLIKKIDKCEGDKPYVPTYQVSKEKAKSLGIEFIPLDVSLKKTVESLKEKGFVHLTSLY
ncbi:hypothetical protein V6Z11_D07G135400 [Gossypium hirsutum]